MPSFLYGSGSITLLLWLVLGGWIFVKAPESLLNIAVFFILLFVTLAFTASFPAYFLLIRKKHHAGLEKVVYRQSLKLGAFCAFIITGFLCLKAFDLVNVFNLGLFGLLCGAMLPTLRMGR